MNTFSLLVSPFKRWDGGGRVIKQNNTVINGAICRNQGIGWGLFLIRAADYDEAVEIAQGCPILKWDAVVEVRMAMPTV